MDKNRSRQASFGTLGIFGTVMLMSLGLLVSAVDGVGFAADQKPPKKSTKNSGKGSGDAKTSAVDVKASEGDTAMAIRGKPGDAERDGKGNDNPSKESEEPGTKTVDPEPKK